MSGSYDDIIHLPHPEPELRKHPRMSRAGRAAQFSPFAALSGYGAAIAEQARLTQPEPQLTEDAQAQLDRALRALARRTGQRPAVRVVWFCPDPRKQGGSYVTTAGHLKEIDTVGRTVRLAEGARIPLDRVVAVEEPEP